ncbi:hypothetical protein ASPZODRAFT_135414 [Penicilliopsis zonata CBS 506.65]|uniref:Uncharacterized protein n=1 Tax=Penicilliopsis zonata CBS 506.65 TaxID=1073090 RepID=A0A1L9S9Y3_9EURO|nr:hypothetical protein ASPZODRAFT_135414 [Penicilliopsis zonata CBS 506.65]OJJ43990.1 hypothetical protein ASPZODRAFT_135414 [Penicilliopsis zonata CBS 506.65]
MSVTSITPSTFGTFIFIASLSYSLFPPAVVTVAVAPDSIEVEAVAVAVVNAVVVNKQADTIPLDIETGESTNAGAPQCWSQAHNW